MINTKMTRILRNDILMNFVIPAKAGIHKTGESVLDSRFLPAQE